jgi:hypothetical protein
MAERHYVAALKKGTDNAAPQDWQERLTQIEGVSVVGATARRVQFSAPEEAAEQLRSELGDYCLIEEVAVRVPMRRPHGDSSE